MADMAQNLKELKEISALLAQHAIGQSARAIRPAALSRLTPPDDFIPMLRQRAGTNAAHSQQFSGACPARERATCAQICALSVRTELSE